MTLVEAAKKGRKIRRISDMEFYGPNFWVDLESARGVVIGREDALAEDWEAQEEELTVGPVENITRK